MKEVYRKRGRVIRREREHLVRVSEAGEAVDDGTTFSVKPLEAKHLPEIDSTAANAAARAIEALVEPPLILERLIVSEGSAEHDCNGAKWSENTRRVHVAIARPPRYSTPARCLGDLACRPPCAAKPVGEARCPAERRNDDFGPSRRLCTVRLPPPDSAISRRRVG